MADPSGIVFKGNADVDIPTPAAGKFHVYIHTSGEARYKDDLGIVHTFSAVTSVAGHTGVVTLAQLITDLDPSFLTPAEANALYDALGAAATAQAAAQAYADSLVVGLWDDRGTFSAAGGAYPATGGSGPAGAIKKGDIWTISVSGTLPTGQVVEVGDTVRALIDTPGNTQANWAVAQNNIGYVPAPQTRNINTTLPLTGGGDLSADRTIAINAATTATAGSMSAIDKLKLDNIWIDVTANTTALVAAANTGAQNITAINAILAAAPNGSTIFFPKGTYLFNAAWTMPANKMFTFLGQGSNRAGAPATAFTELRWNANVGGDLITLPGAGGGWYTQFRDLTFTAITADQASGAVINVNGNVGTNIQNCSFQSAGAFFFDVLSGTGGNGSNSWNSAIISNCNIQGFKGTGIRINSSGSSLLLENSVIQGNWGGFTGTPAANSAAACVSGGFVGALQIIGCDLLGAVNNILLNPVLASSEVCASVFVTNTYLDNSAGSCLKITGTGATVRARFTTCSFTTAGTNYSVAGTNLSAIEIGGSFTYTAGGQAVAFTDCNIFNTFGTTGTNNGILINGTWADLYMNGCAVAGWTNGYNVTPSGVNISMLKVTGGTCGPSGGYGANTTGFNIAAGSYKGVVIQNVNAHNNTTNLTLGAVTVAAADGSLFKIADNTGINPRGAVTTPAVPASTVAVTNTTGFRVSVYMRAGTITAISVNGVVTGVTAAPSATGALAFHLEPGGTVAMTYAVVPTWVWIGH